MIGSGLIMIIRDSARKGKSAYAIGKEQNISKNTAKKYMQVGTLPEPPHKRGSILDPFKPQVNQMMHVECQPKSEPLAHEFLSHSCS